MSIFASLALMPDTWAEDVRIALRNGRIAEIEIGATPRPGDHLVDTLLPAPSNLHSHSFQRAMAGMTEYRRAGRESFWTWRDLMYRFLDHLTPEQIGVIAELAFAEMLEAGYAAVGEFHYVHHQSGGTAYEVPDELSRRIMEAARSTGIGLTHLPVLYSYGDVGGAPLQGGQMRFGCTADTYARLVEGCSDALRGMPDDTRLGLAPHSLRAVSPEDLDAIGGMSEGRVMHIHIAEQVREVDAVQAAYGARPVEWLLAQQEIGPRWCLIHATHMTESETRALAKSGAIVGLCPVTEANLGDGIFNGAAYIAEGGRFGVGTDSNVNISLNEEMRLLEYAQRLSRRERNVMTVAEGSTGASLYSAVLRGGAQALDRDSGEIAEGRLADLVALDSTDPRLCALRPDQLLDGFVFAAGSGAVRDVWSAGRHVVRDGRHRDKAGIRSRYRAAMADLMAAL